MRRTRCSRQQILLCYCVDQPLSGMLGQLTASRIWLPRRCGHACGPCEGHHFAPDASAATWCPRNSMVKRERPMIRSNLAAGLQPHSRNLARILAQSSSSLAARDANLQAHLTPPCLPPVSGRSPQDMLRDLPYRSRMRLATPLSPGPILAPNDRSLFSCCPHTDTLTYNCGCFNLSILNSPIAA